MAPFPISRATPAARLPAPVRPLSVRPPPPHGPGRPPPCAPRRSAACAPRTRPAASLRPSPSGRPRPTDPAACLPAPPPRLPLHQRDFAAGGRPPGADSTGSRGHRIRNLVDLLCSWLKSLTIPGNTRESL
ncbi:hypothetical protein BS78_03G291000 [Paspalum vaginatum]|nr:hypothetical protein BS78_03G291000 [Paspalum vaginatum]